jgi:phosphohistidine phosphatase
MELYFLRHGLAGQHGDPKYKDDSLRPLTAQGQEKTHRAALGMQALGLTFDAVFSSPYLRARQTAETVSRVYKIKKSEIHLTDHLLPPASIEGLLREIHGHFPKSKNVLLVGHEPHLTEMISHLLKSDTHLPIDFKKGGLCCLTLEGPLAKGNAVLNWLLTSGQLGILAKEKE